MLNNFTKILYNYIERFFLLFANSFTFFFTYTKKPKFANNFSLFSQDVNNIHNVSIIIQGPIISKDNFTLETIKIYKKIFPSHIIILSTWLDQDTFIFDNLDIVILKNSYPVNYGIHNINLQIISTKNALDYLKNLNIKYVYKTRTDQRIYTPDTTHYLLNLLNLFPLNNDMQKNRLIVLGMNTFKYRLYGISDMFMFGSFFDMYNYWNCDLDLRNITIENINSNSNTIYNYSRLRVCEVWLSTNYQFKLGRQIKWTLNDSLRFYRDNFIIIDKAMLNLYWGKYTYLESKWINYNKQNNLFQELTFLDWINLMNANLSNLNEDILNNKYEY